MLDRLMRRVAQARDCLKRRLRRFFWEYPHPLIVIGSVFLVLFVPVMVLARLQAGDPVPNDAPVTTAQPDTLEIACVEAGGQWVESVYGFVAGRCQTAVELEEEARRQLCSRLPNPETSTKDHESCP